MLQTCQSRTQRNKFPLPRDGAMDNTGPVPNRRAILWQIGLLSMAEVLELTA